jgi:hypothetical protein
MKKKPLGTAFLQLLHDRQPFVGSEADSTTITRRVARAIRELCDTAPPEEIARFRALEHRAIQSRRIALTDYPPGEFPEGWLWAHSLFIWGSCLECDDAAVFFLLPPHLPTFCAFFLRTWWLSELLGRWYANGDQDRITRLLFGSAKRTRSFTTRMAQYFRDWAIVHQVTYYQHVEKLGINQALQRALIDVNREGSGTRELLTLSGIRTIYYGRTKPRRKKENKHETARSLNTGE